MVRFWQAGEDNTKKVDLWMSKLGMKNSSQPLGATESLATKRAGQRPGLLACRQEARREPLSRLVQRSQLKTTREVLVCSREGTARPASSTKEPKPRRLGVQS